MSQAFLTLTLAALGAAPGSPLPSAIDLTAIRALPVQHDGRYPPLDTVARDIVRQVTGSMFHEGHDPVVLLLAWTFDRATWEQAPLIRIRNAELREELGLSQSKTMFSFAELLREDHLRGLIEDLADIEQGRKMNPLESKVSSINDKLLTLQRVFLGRTIRPIPDPDDELGRWRGMGDLTPNESDQVKAAQTAWTSLGEAFLADDAGGFAAATEELTSTLSALPAAHQPDRGLIATELHYNALRPFRSAWIIMVIGALLAGVALLARRKAVDAFAVIALIVGFAVLTYGLWLRWTIAGRIPASNMYESLVFLSWGIGAFAIVAMVFMGSRIVPLTASAMGAIALILADCLPMSPFIRPMPPVLQDTIWMSIHVPVIMVSYSVLALGVLVAHAQLVVMALFPGRRELARSIDSLHYWFIHVGSVLLLAGIVTGSMWGASSWGRYWGWDPKEVWSLVALLGYLAILHVRVDNSRVPLWAYGLGLLMAVALFCIVVPLLEPMTSGKLRAFAGTGVAMVIFVVIRGPFAAAVKSILAFWMIIMTYVGVNYVLGIGLHSYGFGTGAVVHYMRLLGRVDLGLVVFFALVYLLRRERPTTGVPITATA